MEVDGFGNLPAEIVSHIFQYVGKYRGLAIFVCRSWKKLIGNALSFLVLDAAVKDNNNDLVQWLLKQGVKVTEEACRSTARNGNLLMLQLLYEDSEILYLDGGELIREASYGGHLDIVIWTIARFRVDLPYSKDLYKAFHISCRKGHLYILQRLFEKYMDVNDDNDIIPKCFGLAVRHGHSHIMKWLYEWIIGGPYPIDLAQLLIAWCRAIIESGNYEYIDHYYNLNVHRMDIMWVAIQYGNLKMLNWIQDRYPKLVQNVLVEDAYPEEYLERDESSWVDNWYESAAREWNIDGLNWLWKLGLKLTDSDGKIRRAIEPDWVPFRGKHLEGEFESIQRQIQKWYEEHI